MTYLLIVNETELNDVATGWSIEVLRDWARQRAHLGTVDVVEQSTGRIVFTA